MAPQPLRIQSTTTPVKNTQTQQQLQVGDHIYIKNKISHSDRPNLADSAGVVTDIAHYPDYIFRSGNMAFSAKSMLIISRREDPFEKTTR